MFKCSNAVLAVEVCTAAAPQRVLARARFVESGAAEGLVRFAPQTGRLPLRVDNHRWRASDALVVHVFALVAAAQQPQLSKRVLLTRVAVAREAVETLLAARAERDSVQFVSPSERVGAFVAMSFVRRRASPRAHWDIAVDSLRLARERVDAASVLGAHSIVCLPLRYSVRSHRSVRVGDAAVGTALTDIDGHLQLVPLERLPPLDEACALHELQHAAADALDAEHRLLPRRFWQHDTPLADRAALLVASACDALAHGACDRLQTPRTARLFRYAPMDSGADADADADAASSTARRPPAHASMARVLAAAVGQ